ncbi:serine acetyltransferase [Kosmotoga arenicorallina S304]|uniref:Serine acetyltransferase n=1 Tax=Kosmotoga arenicorallina S304 TaxID=1453497 RepID=A0A176K2Y7_9BACT|nr:serine O-acetyltransferase [Kosmotoga arenicorallina]OAA31342.1 serine acetyltransferase [Kosmotoga arenicorallina S304]
MGNFTNEMMNLLKAVKKDFDEYLIKDPAARSKFHIYLTSAGFHALFLYRLSHLLWNFGFFWPAELIHYFNRVIFNIDIHPAAHIEAGVVIDHGIGVVIGSTATVGSGTLIYHGVTLGSRRIVEGKRHPDIGRNVIIGAGAKILGPIIVGDNAKIGANSVVLEHVPENQTYVGIPAKKTEKIHHEVNL